MPTAAKMRGVTGPETARQQTEAITASPAGGRSQQELFLLFHCLGVVVGLVVHAGTVQDAVDNQQRQFVFVGPGVFGCLVKGDRRADHDVAQQHRDGTSHEVVPHRRSSSIGNDKTSVGPSWCR